MKVIASAVCLLIGFQVQAQDSSKGSEANDQEIIPYTVKERGANHKVWERIEYETRPDGKKVPHIHSYTELASGLSFLNPQTGQWEDADESFEVTSDGFALGRKTQHGVIVSPILNDTDGLVDIQTPDGKRLRSSPLALNVFNRATGESVLLSEISSEAVGHLVAPNEIVFSNAFDGFADVRILNGKGEVHVDTLFNAGLDLKELAAAGFPADVSVLEVWTEYLGETPNPIITSRVVEREASPLMRAAMIEPDVITDNLDFGIMKMPAGRAYLKGGDGNGGEITVTKRWMTVSNRRFVVESIPLAQAGTMFSQLPTRHSGVEVLQAGFRDIRQRPPKLTSVSKVGRTIQMAKGSQNGMPQFTVAQIKPDGISTALNQPVQLVWDPTTVNGNLTNYTFLGADATYYLSGNVNLYGTNTTFESGCVIKSASGVSLTVNTPVTWLADRYRPIVFLSKNDNSAGEILSGSSGNPGTETLATKALYFDATTANTNLTIKYLRVANAKTAVAINGRSGHVLSHVQIKACFNGLELTGAEVSLRNALMDRVKTNFAGSSATGRVEHLTSDTAIWLNKDIGSNLFLTNCLLVAVTNLGSCTTQNVNIVSSSSGVFQQVGGGRFYLATNSVHRDAGTTNINTTLISELRKTTTYPPLVYSNATITVPMILSPQAQRDMVMGDLPDLGYHYEPLDYVFGGSHVNTNLTFTAGTAVGWFRTSSGWYHAGQGIHIDDRQIVTFDGTAEYPCFWVRTSTAQEGSGLWEGGYGPGGITGWADQYEEDPTRSPEIHARFLICSMLAGSYGNHFRDDGGYLTLRAWNSEFWGSSFEGYGTTCYLTNCLMVRVYAGIVQGWPGNEFIAQNCTWIKGGIDLVPNYAPPTIVIKDCSVDRTAVTISGSATNASYATYNHNAYTNASNPFRIGGSGDKQSVSFNWQTGPLGSFYLPTNSVLTNVGSTTADLVGLYHFTTQTNQVKETNSTVDIGYHYVAVDGSGNPVDSDSDGVPDYIEDGNGNGSVNSGETAWQDPTDWGLKVLITRPRNNSVVP